MFLWKVVAVNFSSKIRVGYLSKVFSMLKSHLFTISWMFQHDDCNIAPMSSRQQTSPMQLPECINLSEHHNLPSSHVSFYKNTRTMLPQLSSGCRKLKLVGVNSSDRQMVVVSSSHKSFFCYDDHTTIIGSDIHQSHST